MASLPATKSVVANFARFYIPSSLHHALIGSGGAVLKKIEATHNVKIRIPKMEEKSDLVTVQSLSNQLADEPIEAVAHEFTALLGFPPSTVPLLSITYDIPQRSYGAIIGSQGSVLKELQAKTHTAINMPRRDAPADAKVTATGSKDGLLKLNQELERILGGKPKIVGGFITEDERKVAKKLDLGGVINEVLFFPEAKDSDAKLFRMIEYIRSATKTLDIAVYNMTDDRIARAIEDAFIAGVAVRIISHVSTMSDPGSDVHSLADLGVQVKVDVSPELMHHKFAVIDRKLIINGSFNWTRSAAEGNAENMIITNQPDLVKAFADHFENVMWNNREKLQALQPHGKVVAMAAPAKRH